MIDWLKRLIAAWRYQRHHKATLQKYGWDGKCPACKKWLHTDGSGKCIEETELHWIYRCECGQESAWFLGGPVPLYDNGKNGWPDPWNAVNRRSLKQSG